MSEFSRLELLRTLNTLPPATFEAVRYGVGAPRDVLPGDSAPQGSRGVALLEWAEGPTGCKLPRVQQVLEEVMAYAETTPPNEAPQQTAAPKYDLRGAYFAGGFAETVYGDQIGGTQNNATPEPKTSKPQTHWLVPYSLNSFFTGREGLLEQLRDILTQHQRAALTQQSRAALSGLGGIGKTQTAVEYAYRYQDEYAHIFWVKAEPIEELLTGYSQIAEALQLPGYDLTDRPAVAAVVGLVKRWFETHEGWLLVIDNADDIRAVRPYLPLQGKGHLLLTTRAQALGDVARPLKVNKMGPEEGALFLLRRTRVLEEGDELLAASVADVEVAKAIAAEMDGLPLALDQAGAYIEERQRSLDEYLTLFQGYKARLLKERGQLDPDHPSVTVTFKLAFEKVAEKNAAAADLLRVCAFLATDDIPEEIFSTSEGALGEALGAVAQDELELTEAIAEAARFSLISRNSQAKTLSIHRLVQEVLRDGMDEADQRQWVEGVVEAVLAVFPYVEFENWTQCDRVITHAQVVTRLAAKHGLASETTALLLKRTSSYFKEKGLYTEVEPFLQQALEMNRELLGETHPDVATSLNNLGYLYDSQGLYADAELLYQQALIMRRELLGESHPDVAQSLNNLAGIYDSQGLYADAEPLYQQALAMRRELLGESHPDVAASLNNLGGLYYAQGRYADAELLYQQALAMRRELLGESHPDVAQSLNNLAGIYYAKGRYAEAAPLYKQALAARLELLSESHPDVAASLNNLAVLYQAQGRYAEAEPLYKQALAARLELLGESHPNVAASLNNLASVYRTQGRYAEAEPLYQQALVIYEKMLGPEHPHTQTTRLNLQLLWEAKDHMTGTEYLEGLTSFHEDEEGHNETESIDQEALALQNLKMSKQLWGNEHLSVANSLKDLANLYFSQDRYKEAEPLYQQALAILEKMLGPEHPHTQTARRNLQRLLDKKG